MPHNDDKRERILAAATAVFAERDFHRVQVSEVAQRAGVGKGTLYLYFRTKDALREGALQASLERLADEVDGEAAADVPVEAALRGIVLSILRFFWKRQDLLAVVQRYESGRRRSERRHRVLRAVEAVLARHGIGPTGAARQLSAAFLTGMARAAIFHHATADRPEAAADRIVSVYLHGLEGGAPAARRTAAGRRRQRGAA